MGISEQDAVFNRHGNQAQRFVGLVQALSCRPIELPAVERAFKTRPLVVDGAALVWTDIREKREPRGLPHEEICPPSFGDDSGQPGERVGRSDAKN